MAHSLTQIRLLRFGQLITENLATLSWISGACLILSGFGLLGYQIFAWLRHGYWESFSLLDLVMKVISHWALYSEGYPLDRFVQWLNYPQQWIGLHKIIRGALDGPVSLFAILGGFAIWLPFMGIAEALKDKHRETLLRYLGFTAPLIFEGPLRTGKELERQYHSQGSPFTIFLQPEGITKHSVLLKVDFKQRDEEICNSISIEILLEIYRVTPLCEAWEHTRTNCTKSISVPPLYIALISLWRSEDGSRMVAFAVGEQMN